VCMDSIVWRVCACVCARVKAFEKYERSVDAVLCFSGCGNLQTEWRDCRPSEGRVDHWRFCLTPIKRRCVSLLCMMSNKNNKYMLGENKCGVHCHLHCRRDSGAL